MSALGEAFTTTPFTLQAEKERRKSDRHKAQILADRERRQERRQERKDEIELGRQSLIQTTPRGVLNPQTSGRRRLTG